MAHCPRPAGPTWGFMPLGLKTEASHRFPSPTQSLSLNGRTLNEMDSVASVWLPLSRTYFLSVYPHSRKGVVDWPLGVKYPQGTLALAAGKQGILMDSPTKL